MKKHKSIRTLFVILFSLYWASSYACTTAVISGKFTVTGRPIIWKVRDTEAYMNCMKQFSAPGHLQYVGLINSSEPSGEQIWGGYNSAGFAIMNSASFNVNEGYRGKYKDKEGFLMHQALRECRTLKDFERLLDERPRPMGIASHFGVIDANGGAAFYEVNNDTWTKFDANDPSVAPRGYVLRTNYSVTGTKGKGLGYVRCRSAHFLFSRIDSGRLDVPTIMQSLSRSMYNDETKKDFRQMYQSMPISDATVDTKDLIARYGTASTILVEGINPLQGERPNQTTCWVQIGLPYVSISLPAWCDAPLPSVLVPSVGRDAPLSLWAMKLKKEIYPRWMEKSGHRSLLISKLFNDQQTGIVQQIENVEDDIFHQVEVARMEWRSHPKSALSGKYSKAYLSLECNAKARHFYEQLMQTKP